VSSCLKPNFPYAPFQGRRIRGFDLLADYLFAEPTVIDTPGTVAYVKANDNVTESPVPLEDNIGIETNVSVPKVVPAPLEVKHGDVAPTEFMLFLVRGCRFPHQYDSDVSQGDFIYADIPHYHGDSKHAYRRLYRRNYNSPSFRKVFERLRASLSLHTPGKA